MDEFVERQNITHYVDQLKTEKDPSKRAMLERLLAEEIQSRRDPLSRAVAKPRICPCSCPIEVAGS